MTQIEKIQELHPDLIASFLATGKGEAIPADLRLFLQQLQWAAETFETERSVSRCAAKLRQRIAAEQHVSIEQRTAVARVYEALNFFHVDQSVGIKVWESVYADQFEKIAMLAAVKGDLKTQSKATERALECRRRAAEIADSDRTLGITQLISPDVTPGLLGFETQDLKTIARKNREGAYVIIQSLPIESSEKKRLLTDAKIEELESMEEIINE
ncbi:hypothetical protein [Prevotella sp. tf2-5]|uniref:hypothetical protein n=1 Tax=Prevotella sp. tf2-5 TaxID=1761889 RepID=UPI0008E56F4C|nr:hypothetical protein [Prevotella sp. tf2-5]SFO62168.1 hypothetical protein SAMN04487852_103301 [Prevotella sp. tf2-5]